VYMPMQLLSGVCMFLCVRINMTIISSVQFSWDDRSNVNVLNEWNCHWQWWLKVLKLIYIIPSKLTRSVIYWPHLALSFFSYIHFTHKSEMASRCGATVALNFTPHRLSSDVSVAFFLQHAWCMRGNGVSCGNGIVEISRPTAAVFHWVHLFRVTFL